MDNLIKILQNNPTFQLVTLIITALSGISIIISMILGRKRIRDDILLKKITVPVYAYLIILFFVVLSIIFWPAIEDRSKPLRTIKGESFGVQRIIVDGKRFVNCKFRKTQLVFRGEASSLENCSFEKITFTFGGPAAATMKTLENLYSVPNFRPTIEKTFEAIKEGKLSEAIPPSDAADD